MGTNHKSVKRLLCSNTTTANRKNLPTRRYIKVYHQFAKNTRFQRKDNGGEAMRDTEASRWKRATQAVCEIAQYTRLPIESVAEVIMIGVNARQQGQSELESQQLMDDAIRQYHSIST